MVVWIAVLTVMASGTCVGVMGVLMETGFMRIPPGCVAVLGAVCFVLVAMDWRTVRRMGWF